VGEAAHLIEPRVGWAYVSATSQDGNPLFVPETATPQDRLRLLALDNVTRDPADRIEDENALVFGVANRFLAGSLGALVGELSLLSEYSFAQGEFGPVVLEGTLRPRGGLSVRFHTAYDAGASVFADALFNVGWTHERGHLLGLRYRYLRDVPDFFEAFPYDDRFDRAGDPLERIDQISGVARWQLSGRWALTYEGAYSFENTLSLANVGGVEYLSQCRCWAVRFEVEHDRNRGVQFDLQYRLLGLGDDKEQPFSQARGRGALVDVFGGL
jgi:lipopolysaccharide assembly outer membrane protein LptD (OstA)